MGSFCCPLEFVGAVQILSLCVDMGGGIGPWVRLYWTIRVGRTQGVQVFSYREGGKGKVRRGWIHVCRSEHPVGLEGQEHQMAWAAVRGPSLSGGTVRLA